MKKLLLFLISLCGALSGCHRVPTITDTFIPSDTLNTPPAPKADTVPSSIKQPNPGEYKLLYGVRPTPFETKKMAEDTLKNAKQ